MSDDNAEVETSHTSEPWRFRRPPRVWVITGAARGIGRALAERLLAAGARVVLSDRDDEVLGRTRGFCSGQFGRRNERHR